MYNCSILCTINRSKLIEITRSYWDGLMDAKLWQKRPEPKKKEKKKKKKKNNCTHVQRATVVVVYRLHMYR